MTQKAYKHLNHRQKCNSVWAETRHSLRNTNINTFMRPRRTKSNKHQKATTSPDIKKSTIFIAIKPVQYLKHHALV